MCDECFAYQGSHSLKYLTSWWRTNFGQGVSISRKSVFIYRLLCLYPKSKWHKHPHSTKYK